MGYQIGGKQLELLSLLEGNQPAAASKLAETLSLSEKTVRSRIAEINDALDPDIAYIQSLHRQGYILVIHDRRRYLQWIHRCRLVLKGGVPESSEDRVYFILVRFLTDSGYIHSQSLCDDMQIGQRTLSYELKKTAEALAPYGLAIEHKPYYGMRLAGPETAVRRFAMERVLRPDRENRILAQCADVLKKTLAETGTMLDEKTFSILTECMYIMLNRVEIGCYANVAEKDMPIAGKLPEYKTAGLLLKNLSEAGFTVPDIAEETAWLALCMAGNRIQTTDTYGGNMVVSEDEIALVYKMLKAVRKTYSIDFEEIPAVKIALYNQIYALVIRLRYDIPTENPYRSEIRQKYTFAWQMAQVAMIPVEEETGRQASDDEVSMLALILQMGLESHRIEMHRNAFLVCRENDMKAYYLFLRLSEEFHGSVTIDKIIDRTSFEKLEKIEADCIFSTVPVSRAVAVPVYMIHEELQPRDISLLKRMVSGKSIDVMKDLLDEKLVFLSLQAKSREEAIRIFCQKIEEVIPQNSGMAAAVLKRESNGSSESGCLTAFPHPHRHQPVPFFAIGVLEHPVQWKNEKVQVMMMPVTEDGDAARSIYAFLSIFCRKPDNIGKLIRARSAEEAVNLILMEYNNER